MDYKAAFRKFISLDGRKISPADAATFINQAAKAKFPPHLQTFANRMFQAMETVRQSRKPVEVDAYKCAHELRDYEDETTEGLGKVRVKTVPDALSEARRHLANARQILAEKGKLDADGAYYKDAKYVAEAAGVAYIGALLAVDAWMLHKGKEVDYKSITDVSTFIKANAPSGSSMRKDFRHMYEILHLNAYYGNLRDYKTIAGVLDSLAKFIKDVEALTKSTKGLGAINERKCYAKKIEVSKIHTDESRFQNRDAKFSEASAVRVAEQFDKNKFDPIVVWKDNKDGKIYVLSGHSRLEGVRRLNKRTIPVRFFEGSEEAAITFARVDANRAASPETLAEDLAAFRLMRDGDKKKGVAPVPVKELRKVFGNYNALERFSYLNPKGLFIKALMQNDTTQWPYLKTKASWVGELRKTHKELTHTHERDIYLFLYSGTGEGLKLDKDSFTAIVEKRLALGKERLFPECDNFGCEKVKDTDSAFKTSKEKKLAAELAKKTAELKTITERLKATAPHEKVWTKEEREALRVIGNTYKEEIKALRRDLNLAEKGDAELF